MQRLRAAIIHTHLLSVSKVTVLCVLIGPRKDDTQEGAHPKYLIEKGGVNQRLRMVKQKEVIYVSVFFR